MAAVASGVLAGPASAGTVNGYHDTESRDVYVGVDVTARGGQRNNIEVEVGHRVRVVERGQGRLRALGNCRRESKKVVSCPRKDATDGGSLNVSLRDGSDVARLDAGPFSGANVEGGEGADVLELTSGGTSESYYNYYGHIGLHGGPGGDTLFGGPKEDVLYGGSGRDRIYGRSGPDMLSGDGFGATHSAGPNDDLLDGGKGRDVGSWDGRRRSVTVDLRGRARGGVRGETDRLRSIEDVRGGYGRDRLTGNDRANNLIGGWEADTLLGGGGADEIDGGTAADLLFGFGAGPDRANDRIDCGRGRDLVRHVGVRLPDRGFRTDALPQSCERVRIDRKTVGVPQLVLGADRIVVQVTCRSAGYSCKRWVIVRSNGVELGQSGTRTTRRKSFFMTVPLRRPLDAGAPLVVLIRGTNKDYRREGPYEYGFRFRLLRP